MKFGRFEVPGYYVGDCRALPAELPDESVNCVGLQQHPGGPPGDGLMLRGGRAVIEAQAAVKDIDAGALCEPCAAWRGQLGLEPTPEAFVDHLANVFRDVRRVLRTDGTLWLNLGDSYCTVPHGPKGANTADPKNPVPRSRPAGSQANRARVEGLKHKDMVGIPWRVAFALQADGWWLRSDVIWAKPNPMPESVTDRPTRAHEYLFLLTKSDNYAYDARAIMEPVSGTARPRGAGVNPKARGKNEQSPDHRKHGFNERWRVKQNESFSAAIAGTVDQRNKRSVWTITTEPTPDAHFATFPRKLVEPCILAGCPAGGVVLDPFGGSGTVGRVAEDLGRKWLLFDLNSEYAKIADRKTAQRSLLGLVSSPTEAA
jgi:DNA modification methylase